MVEKIKHRISLINPIDFSIQLTIFFTIVHFSKQLASDPLLFIPIIIAASIGMLFQEVRYSITFWLIQVTFYFIWVYNQWQIIDNHRYLWGYWMIAVLVGILHKNKSNSIKISAKYLIAGCMLFAITQKIISPHFMSGDFFYYVLLTDGRFGFLGHLINYNLYALAQQNNEIINLMQSNVSTYKLNLGPSILYPISQFLTWYVIIIEAAIGIIFLLPRKIFHYWQHWLLLIFSTMYFLLPIKGFAFTILILGFCLLKKMDTQLKMIYFFFFIYIFTIATYLNEFIF